MITFQDLGMDPLFTTNNRRSKPRKVKKRKILAHLLTYLRPGPSISKGIEVQRDQRVKERSWGKN